MGPGTDEESPDGGGTSCVSLLLVVVVEAVEPEEIRRQLSLVGGAAPAIVLVLGAFASAWGADLLDLEKCGEAVSQKSSSSESPSSSFASSPKKRR